MATPQGVLKKSAVIMAALAIAGGTASAAQAKDSAAAAPAYVTLSVLSPGGAPVYAEPSSSSHRYRVDRAGTKERIQCSTTKTPSGNMWFRIYDSHPVGWVWSGHFASQVHPPKECFPG
ncbi:hypothetical protein GCM10023086_65260 [Streptomyces venetus]|uniref:SH3 domain-containing protein n=1 Tax=Streptomyces venetus TaxID=1701086 RepID=A0ABP8H3V6_9ACTN